MKKREFKWGFVYEKMPGICLGVGIINDQPRKHYSTANWDFVIIILCFGFRINLQYNYKYLKK